MTDEKVVEQPKPETVIPSSPFQEGSWKSEPTLKSETIIPAPDPVIKEKDEQIKEEKPESAKPNEAEKIPGATPAPIQERPVNDDAATKKEEPLKFANEESEKVHNLLVAGEIDKALSILNEQKKLKEVDKLPAADLIKLNLQYQNKDFSADDINDLFSERYALPEKPEQATVETDEDFEERVAKYEKEVQKVENRIKRDAKPAATELQKLAKEIVLPDIKKQDPVQPEPTQEELDAQKKAGELFLQSVEEGLKNFNGYETTFKDEEVEIKVAYVPTDDEKKQYQPLLALAGTDAGGFLKGIGWLDGKGDLNIAKIAEDLPLILGKEKVFQKIASETGNKRHEASIKSIKNIDYSGKGSGNGELGATHQQKESAMVNHFFSQ